jgi:hypothetical protein
LKHGVALARQSLALVRSQAEPGNEGDSFTMISIPEMVGIAVVFVSGALIVAQLALGSAFLGNDRPVQRSKAPFHFCFIIAIQSFAVLVGILSIGAFR